MKLGGMTELCSVRVNNTQVRKHNYIRNGKQSSVNAIGFMLKKYLASDMISFGYESSLKHVAKTCAYCGIEVLTDIEVEEYTKKILESRGKDLIKVLKQVSDYHNTRKKKSRKLLIIKDIIQLAKKYPDKTGETLIEKYKASKREEFAKQSSPYRKVKHELLSRLEDISTRMPSEIAQKLNELLENPPLRLTTIVTKLNCIKYTSKNVPSEFEALVDELTEIVRSDRDRLKIISFLEKSWDDKPEAMARLLVEPLMVTMEHIKPRSKEGSNSTYNFLPVCRDCNSKRGNIEFVEWVASHPEIKKFIKYCLEQTQKAIDKLPNPPEVLNYYVKKVVQILKNESGGLLDIKMSAETLK